MAAGKIIKANIPTKRPISPDSVLNEAVGKLKTVLVIGWEEESGDFYAASSDPDGGTVLWLLESCKNMVMGK